jgi:carboxymethylenebutenolidase
VEHAFFNDSRPEVYNETESRKAWDATVAFFRETVR